MANHLIIGLGGTGGKIIRELRKRIVEECGSLDPGNGTHIEYIYVDSSLEDLNDRSKWKVMGKSVHLGDSQKVSIFGINKTILDDPIGFPGIHSFITPQDKQLIDENLGTLIDTGIGGQRRRLGRLLFANNICDNSKSDNFIKTLRNAVSKLWRESHRNEVTFHICAGLAGGTGSGTIIDAIAQIRKEYPYDQNTHNNKIRLFTYVPEISLENKDANKGFYQANGFAALQELNAISVNSYAPRDISGEIDHATNEVQRLLQNDESFEIAYLYTNVNEVGEMKYLENTLPESVADFIYQTIIVANAPNINGAMQRLVHLENAGAQPERDSSGIPSRSVRFMSFGISKAIFPENEIKEYISYSFANSAIKFLLYNHWSPGHGYNEHLREGQENAMTIDITNRLADFRLTDAYLTTEQAVVSDKYTGSWRNFEDSWKESVDYASETALEDYSGESILDQFKKEIDTIVGTQFRGVGLDAFFKNQISALEKSSTAILNRIEEFLFTEWTKTSQESMGLVDMPSYLDVIKRRMQEKNAQFSAEKISFQTEKKELEKKLNKKEGEVRMALKIAPMGTRLILRPYSKLTRDYYLIETKIKSREYAISLTDKLIEKVNNLLHSGIEPLIDGLNSFLSETNKQMASRCKENNNNDGSAILKIYEPQKVRIIADSYYKDDALQRSNCERTTTAIIGLFGKDQSRSFHAVKRMIDLDIFLDTVFTVQARESLLKTARENPDNKLVDVNILEKIENRYKTQEARESFIDDLSNRASAQLPFNTEQTALNIGGGTITNHVTQIAIPMGDTKLQEFRNILIDEFSSKLHLNPGTDISDTNKSNELVIVRAAAGFPLRYSLNLKTLKKEYDKLVSKNRNDYELNKMVLHTESFDRDLPSLYELRPEDIREMAVKPLFLAFAMGIIRSIDDPDTGEKYYALIVPDSMGEKSIELGSGFVMCLDNLSKNLSNTQQLIELVNKKMHDSFRHKDRKKELKEKIKKIIDEDISKLYNNNQRNSKYQEFRSIADEINNTILKTE